MQTFCGGDDFPPLPYFQGQYFSQCSSINAHKDFACAAYGPKDREGSRQMALNKNPKVCVGGPPKQHDPGALWPPPRPPRLGGPLWCRASISNPLQRLAWRCVFPLLNLFSQRLKNLENSARPSANFRGATYLKFGV